MPSLLHIGTIRRAHGLRGQVKLALDHADSEVFEHIDHIWVSAKPGQAAPENLQKWQLSEVRSLESGLYLVTLDGIADRTAAEAMQLREVYAERDKLPELGEDEVYQADLIGCKVVHKDGGEVGSVRGIDQMGGNVLLVVEREGRQPALVPLVPAIVTNVDLAARTVEIDPPEGLLDLDKLDKLDLHKE